jgi:hypothetical protein
MCDADRRVRLPLRRSVVGLELDVGASASAIDSELSAAGNAQRRPDFVYEWLLPHAARASGVTIREAVNPLSPAQRVAIAASRV